MTNLKTLALVDCKRISNNGLKDILDNCVNLRELTVHRCKLITGKGLDFQHNSTLHSFTLAECEKVKLPFCLQADCVQQPSST